MRHFWTSRLSRLGNLSKSPEFITLTQNLILGHELEDNLRDHPSFITSTLVEVLSWTLKFSQYTDSFLWTSLWIFFCETYLWYDQNYISPLVHIYIFKHTPPIQFIVLDRVLSYKTCSSARRPLFLHALSFECTSKLCITFLNQFSVYFHI